MVLDNLSTHTPPAAGFYESFPAEQARLCWLSEGRVRVHAPVHGGVAEDGRDRDLRAGADSASSEASLPDEAALLGGGRR